MHTEFTTDYVSELMTELVLTVSYVVNFVKGVENPEGVKLCTAGVRNSRCGINAGWSDGTFEKGV